MKTNPNDVINGPIFILTGHEDPDDLVNSMSEAFRDRIPLTKREYFAVHAPDSVTQHAYTLGECKEIFKTENYSRIPNYKMLLRARLAVAYADALIAELNKEKT